MKIDRLLDSPYLDWKEFFSLVKKVIGYGNVE
jgi:hypothetical protein